MAKAPDPKTITIGEHGEGVTPEMRRAKAKEKADTFNAYAVTVHVDGKSWRFRAGDVTARHVAMLRDQSGKDYLDPVRYLLVFVSRDAASIDMVAQLVFLARLQAGDRVTLDEVGDSFTAGSEVWLEFPDEQGLPGSDLEVAFPDPPVSGGASVEASPPSAPSMA